MEGQGQEIQTCIAVLPLLFDFNKFTVIKEWSLKSIGSLLFVNRS